MKRIEDYMIDMDLTYEEVGDNMWMIEDEYTHIDNIIVKYEDPIVLFRVKVMDVPVQNQEKLYQRLLELNSSGLLHGAYALEGNSVVLIDTLESENMDRNEFHATIDSLTMALSEHYSELKSFHQ